MERASSIRYVTQGDSLGDALAGAEEGTAAASRVRADDDSDDSRAHIEARRKSQRETDPQRRRRSRSEVVRGHVDAPVYRDANAADHTALHLRLSTV